ASRKALEGAARQAAAPVRDRLTRSLSTSQAPEMLDAATAIAASPSFPDLGEVTTLTGVLFQELKLSGTISILPDSISLPDGTTAEGRVLRVGGMLAAAAFGDGDYAFAQPVGDGRRLMTVQADVPASAVRLIEQAFTPGATAFPADFSDGGVYRRFVAGRTFWEHILAGGVLIWPIIGLGIFAFLLGLFRYLRLLLVRFGSSRVLDQFFALAREQKLDEARDLLGRQKTRRVPVYRVLTHMLDEWNEAGIASLEKCRDEAILNTMAPLERGISFVAVAAAIAPLLGLLGTVTGMISTFDVITIFGNSDPKLLSGGISVALVTTELGLIAAIPLMFLHFFLSRRVATLVNDMEEKGAVLIARVSAGGADAGAAP
ncbi:MAG: MotA/TolQ/ExbB proton channel family protein, partial [Planctomycetes bacterium]|nr:MotA/TolQ/ExbB proton channel family protein [Planctomycetota bacterium]